MQFSFRWVSLQSRLSLSIVKAMRFLRNFSLLFRFGRIAGLFPDRIQLDPNGQFQRFVFSWCHPITIWCIFSFVLQFGSLYVTIRFLATEIHLPNMAAFPKIVTSVLVTTAVTHYAMILVSRVVTLRYHQLRSIINSIDYEVVRNLEDFNDQNSSHCQNETRKRTIIGIVLILLTVGINFNVAIIHSENYN